MADVNLRILLSAIGGGAVASAINDVAKSIGSGGLGGVLLGVGVVAAAAAVAIGTVAVKAAGDFNAQTERLVTSAGELQSNLSMVRSGILQMSIDTATSTSQLSAGMYYVESSGYRAGAALTVLGVAARGAKSENADLDVVSKALTTTMVDYHMASGQAADAMNGLIATVQNGKTNLQDLSTSMGNVLPIASSLGISFPQVAGAMDTMTNAGMSAHQASQNLAHVLLSLSAPTNVAVKSMKEVGLSAQGVKDALTKQGLPEALQQIEDAVGKKFPAGSVAYETALKNILGGMVGFKLAAQLTGSSLGETKSNIDKVASAMKNGHGAVMGWSEVQGTFNFKVAQAQQALNVLMIQIGTALLPVIGNVVSGITTVIVAVTDWIVKNNAIQVTITAIGTALTATGTFIQNTITTIQNIASAISTWWNQAHLVQSALNLLQGGVQSVQSVIQGAISVVQAIIGWFIQWRVPILSVAGAITLFFLPALIKAGVEAAVAGTKIAVNFVQTIITTGTQATINGAKTLASFVASMVTSGVQAVINGAKVTASFVASMAKAGVEAVVNGAKITAQFVASLIKTGIEGWAAAGKLAALVAQFVATGVQAVIAGAKMTAQFIASIVKAGVSAVVTAGQFVASLIPAITSFIAQSILAAATAIPPMIAGFIAWTVGAWSAAAATIAATWPILLIIAAIALLVVGIVLLVTHWSQVVSFIKTAWAMAVAIVKMDLQLLGAAFSWLGTQAHNIISSIGDFFSGLGTRVHDVVFGIIDLFQSLPGKAVAAIQSLVTQGVKLFQGFWTSVVNDAKSLLGNIGNEIAGIFKSAINAIFINPINNIINGVNNVTGKIGIPAIPHIPQLVSGGTIATGGLAVVGEQGPELVRLPGGATVYPHGTAPAGYGAGAPTNIFYISISTMARSQSEISRFVDMVEQEIGRRFRSTTPGYSSGGVF